MTGFAWGNLSTIATSLTYLYVALQAIQMQRDVCAKGGSCTFIFGANATPMLNLRQ